MVFVRLSLQSDKPGGIGDTSTVAPGAHFFFPEMAVVILLFPRGVHRNTPWESVT